MSGEGAISTLEQKPPAASDLARQEMAGTNDVLQSPSLAAGIV